jgi:hypothetical protein
MACLAAVDGSVGGLVISQQRTTRTDPQPPTPPHDTHGQAAGNSDDPASQRSAWYSNPAASHSTAAVRSGVGKYIQDAKLDAAGGVGGRAAAAAATAAAAAAPSGDAGGAMQPPAAKKPKTQSFGNFDAW